MKTDAKNFKPPGCTDPKPLTRRTGRLTITAERDVEADLLAALFCRLGKFKMTRLQADMLKILADVPDDTAPRG